MKNHINTLWCLFALLLAGIHLQAQQVSFGGLRARSIGPALTSGRVTDIEGVAGKPEVVYIGAANGGVWKSQSGGASFRPVFEDFPQSIGKIAVDQKHPDTVWVGAGESWVRNSTSVGSGIYVSKNGGNTWEFKGLPNSERISNIVIDRDHPEVIYVAVQGALWNASEDRGVYKSIDFGKTWERTLFVDANTGCADLAVDPRNPQVLYAAMWEHRRQPDFFSSGGKGSALYKTVDGGKTWNKIHDGLPSGLLGRMAIGIAPSKPDVMYLSVEAEKKDDKGMYKSTDAGLHWKKVNGDFNTMVRPFYFSRIVVDPLNENKVFKCGFNLICSEDGGNTFRLIGGVHSDVHDVWISPDQPTMVYLGCDGGAYRALDGGYLFEMCMDLPISQPYHVAVDFEKPYNVYCGLQDNGSWYAPSVGNGGGIQNFDWKPTYYGDGFWSFPHPKDPDVVYAEMQGGGLVRYNKKDGQSKDIQPVAKEGEPELRFNWNAPIHISPNNPEHLYIGAQYLFMSEDRGNSWKRISPDLSTNDTLRQRQKRSGGLSIDNSTAENNTTIYSIAVSPKDEKVIWVGTDDGNIQVTQDGGKYWNNVVANIQGLPKGLWVSSLEPSHFDRNTAYVTIDGHRSGDKKPYVFKTTDLGKTWTALNTADIDSYVHVLKEDLQSPNLLFLGTEFGLFISIDQGNSWKRFTNNLPRSAVMDMVIHPRDNALVLATHGRGVYILDDLSPLRQINSGMLEQELSFMKNGPKILKLSKNGTSFGGAGNFVGENPSESAFVVYYMKKRHTIGSMSMKLYDQQGQFVKDLVPGKSAGINVVEIPTRLPMPKAAPTNNPEALYGSFTGPTMAEGFYTVKIQKGAQEYTTQIQLMADPESPFPAVERALQQETAMKLYDQVGKLGYMYYALQDMHMQSSALTNELSDKELVQSLEVFAKEVEKYKDALVSLEGDFYIDSGEAIREKISKVYAGVVNYPGKPSTAQLEQTKYFEGELSKIQTRFETFVARMNELNTQLDKAGKNSLHIKTLKQYLEE